MDWIWMLVLVAAFAAVATLKRAGLVSPAKARTCLRQGAKVIDVRSPAEFAAGHLPGAVNIPLDQLRDQIGRQLPDKSVPVLLHCLSGMRSGMARRALRGLGYVNAHNLGSYSRAEGILHRGGDGS